MLTVRIGDHYLINHMEPRNNIFIINQTIKQLDQGYTGTPFLFWGLISCEFVIKIRIFLALVVQSCYGLEYVANKVCLPIKKMN